MRLFRITILLLLAGVAGAQEVSTTIVPVVGSVFGPSMIRWLTDVELVNQGSLPVDVALELPAAPDDPVIMLTLGPGQVQRFTDIVGQAFGLDSALSPLRVTTAGRRPVTVHARAYALQSGEVSTAQDIEVYPGEAYYPVRALDGLAFSDEYRTNIGLVNAGETDAYFLLALQRIPGRNVAITQIRVSAGSIIHASIQTLFPMITNGHGFTVVVETPSRQTYVYASVIENSTNSGKFIPSRIGSH